MTFYAGFLTGMSLLFVLSAVVLLGMTVIMLVRRRGRRAAAYLGLSVLACGVAAGFYFFRALI